MQPDGVACRWYGDEWYKRIYSDSEEWLKKLDKQPGELEEKIASVKDRRLGKYFETLWAFYFLHSTRFRVIAQNRQIFSDGETLGELDLIVLDESTGSTIHIELAVKFYLGIGDTTKQSNWHGPGKRDRLDTKIRSLIEKQSTFAQHPIVNEILQTDNISVDGCAVILKGRLFYPVKQRNDYLLPQASNPHHLKHKWCTYHDFNLDQGTSYLPLIRSGWMAGQPFDPIRCIHTKKQLDQLINTTEIRLPVSLLGFADGVETCRLFVVPDEWTNGIVKR